MEQNVPKAQDRLDVLERQQQYELEGKFDQDVEIDPPKTRVLKKGEVDFERKKIFNKIKARWAFRLGQRFINKMKKAGLLQVEKINGAENIRNLSSGAVLTCNHFNVFDSFAMQIAYQESKPKGRKFFRIIKEANYTDFPGIFGFFMRNCNTLPLSENRGAMNECMSATDSLLKEGHLVLIYPEQAMWWNYRKPRPLKSGAFKIAAKAGVPVVPIFITMKDSETIGPDGFPIQKYIVNVEKPIYPDKDKSYRENAEIMMQENASVWKNIYEKTYNMPLSFTTITNEEKNNVESKNIINEEQINNCQKKIEEIKELTNE